ncbi:hypothetical protein RJ55_01658 [Drechmeria coniospora]|nr:hypothetical protein RJ55_01658 [Drechmeria coniospora]
MALSFAASHYAAVDAGDCYRPSQHPQPPPSPPALEDPRCSLPSISKLLGLPSAASPPAEPLSASPFVLAPAEVSGTSSQEWQQEASCVYVEARPGSSYATFPPRRGMPPTPPMGVDASFDGYGSPLSKPMCRFPSASTPRTACEATPPLESDARRHHVAPRSQPGVSCPKRPYADALFAQHPGLFASPQPQISNLFYQQPLPQSFPPLSIPLPIAPTLAANPWQHHHYLSPAHAISPSPSQDRYVCQTCSKAFSRPSSLRIHSHSHTGEKPFRCPYAGCGKAFSVRSNMKRHERGCHSF